MDRISDPSATPQRLFTDGDDLAGIQGTIVRDVWLNGMQEEAMTLLLAGDQVGNVNDNTLWRHAVSRIGRRRAVLTASGSWTVPATVVRIAVKIWGGGGGSGGTYGPTAASLGGGYGEDEFDVVPGTVLPVTIGAGGVGGVGGVNPTAGGPGGTSSLGTLCSATGGMGGAPSSSGFPPGVSAGGSAYGTALAINGSTCSAPFAIANGLVTSQGGAAFGGLIAHFGAAYGSALGIPGAFPGGGASGSAAQAGGGAGAPGVIVIFY